MYFIYMPHIVFFEVEEWEEPILKGAFDSEEIDFVREPLTSEAVKQYSNASVISTFIYSKLSKDVLQEMPDVKFIATRSTGYDHIDMEYCRQKEIIVSNVPSYGVHTVAEHTFALILALAKNLIPSNERTKKGDFTIEGLQGIDLNGKTIGIIGAGKIGTEVIHIARCFGMHVLVYSRHPMVSDNHNIEYIQDLEGLLGRSDVLTLHLPLTSDTHHFLNKDNMFKLKKGALLVNTARGGLVETEALLEALEKGIIKGAGLDVLEDECDLREERELLASEFLKSCDLRTQVLNNALLHRNDVIVTPHNAFHTDEAVQEILDVSVENIKKFLQGKPQNTVEQE